MSQAEDVHHISIGPGEIGDDQLRAGNPAADVVDPGIRIKRQHVAAPKPQFAIAGQIAASRMNCDAAVCGTRTTTVLAPIIDEPDGSSLWAISRCS